MGFSSFNFSNGSVDSSANLRNCAISFFAFRCPNLAAKYVNAIKIKQTKDAESDHGKSLLPICFSTNQSVKNVIQAMVKKKYKNIKNVQTADVGPKIPRTTVCWFSSVSVLSERQGFQY